jgi:lysophospholipase L1-like esterase
MKNFMSLCCIVAVSLCVAGAGGVGAAADQQPVMPGQALPGLMVSAPKPGDADFPSPSPSGRHDGKVKAVRSGDYDLVLIGDSITECIGDAGGEWEPIKAVWKRHYEPRKAVNLGYSGFRTENILWTLSNGELEFKKSPKVFRILLGTNNLDDQHYPRVHTAEQVFAGIRAIVNLIRGKFPDSKILILRILPSGGSKDKTTYNRVYCRSDKALQALRDAGAMTSALADGEHVFWLDINHVFTRPDGTINSDLMPDLIHPNAAGHEAMAQAIEPELARLMGDKPIVDEPANTAIVPISQLEENGYDWFGRHAEIIKLGKQLNPEVVFIGDSITHGWGGLPAANFKHADRNTIDKAFGDIRERLTVRSKNATHEF